MSSAPRSHTPDASRAQGYVGTMKHFPTRVLVLGGSLFLLGAVFLFLWLSGGSRLFLLVGTGFVSAAALTLVVAARWMAVRPDPLEARREQRLWRSGPLGRWWLGRRRRLP